MKKWFDPFFTAFSGVITHKLRSFLTMLGIVIGVGAVITLMSIGKGAEQQILSNIQSLGSNLISISPGAGFFGGVRGGSTQTLTLQDAQDIVDNVPDIAAVAPVYNANSQLIAGDTNTNAQIIGTTPSYLDVNNMTLAEGSFFSGQDYTTATRVIVLGSSVADTLFPNGDAVGQQVRMGTIMVHVIGVLNSKGVNFDSPDNAVVMPLTSMQQTLAQPRTTTGEPLVSSITLTTTNSKYTQTVIAYLTDLLRTNHHLASTASNDFNITSTEEIAATLSSTVGTLTLLLGAIAAISLVVGGIGVMNIMLVSVLERTREIGIRKALGAKQRDIWGQFLIEAAFLSLAGGVIGVIAGWLVAYFINRFNVITTYVTGDIVALAVGVAVAIGLFFGFYPAWNASRLNPIEALRAE